MSLVDLFVGNLQKCSVFADFLLIFKRLLKKWVTNLFFSANFRKNDFEYWSIIPPLLDRGYNLSISMAEVVDDFKVHCTAADLLLWNNCYICKPLLYWNLYIFDWVQLHPGNSNCQGILKLLRVIGVSSYRGFEQKDQKHLIKVVLCLCKFFCKISSNVKRQNKSMKTTSIIK